MTQIAREGCAQGEQPHRVPVDGVPHRADRVLLRAGVLGQRRLPVRKRLNDLFDQALHLPPHPVDHGRKLGEIPIERLDDVPHRVVLNGAIPRLSVQGNTIRSQPSYHAAVIDPAEPRR
jgi:hypothetical protein